MKKSHLILVISFFITLFIQNPHSTAQTEWVNIKGRVTFDGTALCAMVLANGQYMFTCNTDNPGVFDLEVPLDDEGEITLLAFATGFSPFKTIITPDQPLDIDINMTRAAAGSREIDITLESETGIVNPNWARISGTVTYDGTPLCAIVIANGQHMFSCGNDLGTFDMEVPLDGNGEITVLVFVSGFLPYKIIHIPEDLGAGEISEYEGQPLSSINDFRENSIQGPQYINQESYELAIFGLVESPVSYSYADVVQNFDRHLKVITLNCVEGWSVKVLWEGVLVRDVIEEAGVLGDAKVIIFHAYDGYTTSFPVSYIMENDILMAYKMNNVRLPPERGFPFELVAEGKWGFKWIKWIVAIELSDDENYRGFYESRGYSNSGDQCGQGGLAGQPPGHPVQRDCCICHSHF